MLTSNPRTTGQGTDRPRPWWLLALAVVLCGADPYRPAPKFTGRTIPAPPLQGEPWKPPETPLPRFLVDASATLFEAGMADPRGCEYREVEIGVGGIVKTRGFVLSERPGVEGRFVVAWDGVVFPVVAVGPAADLDADVRTLATLLSEARDGARARQPGPFQPPNGFATSMRYGGISGEGYLAVGVEARSPLKVCLLLRLGRGDLAATLFAAGTSWTPDTPRRDLTDYHINLISMAGEWADGVYAYLLMAHERGEDGIALDAARRLAKFKAAIEARASALGFPRPDPNRIRTGPPSYFTDIDDLAVLLADHERRAREGERTPIPPRGADPSARIGAMIRDLDQIHVVQFMSPGSAEPGSAAIVRELVAEGDPAVEPLLASLESDERLTRSVSRRGRYSHVHPTTDAVEAALLGILKTSRDSIGIARGPDSHSPASRKLLARAMREYWEKNRAVPLAERWYRTLRDDAAGERRWLEAASGLVQPVADPGSRPDPKGPVQGEPVRGRRDPSVSDLLARRALDLAPSSPNTIPDIGLIRACELGVLFARWDPAAALPTLKTLMTLCRERSFSGKNASSNVSYYARWIGPLAALRARAGDPGALDEFADWARRVDPRAIDSGLLKALEPMWIEPDRPAIAEAARAMFLDPGSPWLPLIPLAPGRHFSTFDDPLTSPLLLVAAFREAVIAALADRSPAGTATRREDGGITYRLSSGTSGSLGGASHADRHDPPGIERTLRACDLVAWRLSTLEGAPTLHLSWANDRRDAAVASAVAYLRRYGPRLSAEGLPGEHDSPFPRAHLRFPILGRPATEEETRDGRAIFSLEGEGEVRVAPLRFDLPILARRIPPEGQDAGASEYEDPSRTARVWQAEEVRRGDRWERFYGLVGPGVLAKVPATEILFPARSYFAAPPLAQGLGASIRLDGPQGPEIPAGRPILVNLSIRNGSGVVREAPTEFVRRAEGGKPALRRGVAPKLVAANLAEDRAFPQRFPLFGQGDEVPPGPIARFEPGDAVKELAPTESFDAATVDLNDWFPDLKPGHYRFQFSFADDSGLGKGMSDQVFFRIR